MCSLFLILAGLLPPADGEQASVAMVLEAAGGAQVKPSQGEDKRAAPMMVLFPGDRLVVPEGGRVIIIIFKDKHRERLSGKREAVVRASGCEPAKAVESLPAVEKKLVSSGLNNLKVSSRGAFQLFRSEAGKDPPYVTPIPETAVVSDRPSFSWQPDGKATKYHVEVLRVGSSQVVWSVTTDKPKLTYPKGEPALRRGRAHEWRVLAEIGTDPVRKLFQSTFTVASEEIERELSELKELAESKRPSDRLLAALAYQSAGAFEEALQIFERLSAQEPKEPEFLAARAEFYERAGRRDEARKAWDAAKRLGYQITEKKATP
jgi:tetratricopeptide (TPR) repeat protein